VAASEGGHQTQPNQTKPNKKKTYLNKTKVIGGAAAFGATTPNQTKTHPPAEHERDVPYPRHF